MSEQIEKSKAPIISTRSTIEFMDELDNEASLRGHTRSEALGEILRLGFPRYLKKFPKKFERIDGAAA